MIIEGLLYALTGMFAGLMSGILGIGGGVIVVPSLAFIFQQNDIIPQQWVMQFASGTSLALMVFTSLASFRAHYILGGVLWDVIYKLWPGVVLGACSGAVIAQFTSTFWLKNFFAVFLILIALHRLSGFQVKDGDTFPRRWLNYLVCFLMGTVSGLLGVGGGILMVPYLSYCGLPLRKIPPVANLSSFAVALTGTIVFMTAGLDETHIVSYSTGAIYWPAVLFMLIPGILTAPLGARLNYLLPVKQLQTLFIVILLLTAIKMLT